MFIHIYSNGEIWIDNSASRDPKTFKGTAGTAGTLVTCVRVNSDASHQKIATLTGSGNSSASALADSLGKGTGAAGDKFKVSELS